MPDKGESETATPVTPIGPVTQSDLKHYKEAAIALVQHCVRNTQLEKLHAGITPSSQSGSYDDVTIVSPYGEIPWNEVLLISDLEMKALMTDIVNKVFTFLVHTNTISDCPPGAKWNEPEFDAALLALVEHRKRPLGSSQRELK